MMPVTAGEEITVKLENVNGRDQINAVMVRSRSIPIDLANTFPLQLRLNEVRIALDLGKSFKAHMAWRDKMLHATDASVIATMVIEDAETILNEAIALQALHKP